MGRIVINGVTVQPLSCFIDGELKTLTPNIVTESNPLATVANVLQSENKE